jgi:HTH-type transcriptional regulator/antitoxin HigA
MAQALLISAESGRYIPFIDDQESYDFGLDRAAVLMDSEDEDDKQELRILSLLIEAYEERTAPEFPDNPVDAISFFMAQNDLNQSSFAKLAHMPTSRVSEVLSGKRGLSIDMIRQLHFGLRIPLNALIAEQNTSGNGK